MIVVEFFRVAVKCVPVLLPVKEGGAGGLDYRRVETFGERAVVVFLSYFRQNYCGPS